MEKYYLIAEGYTASFIGVVAFWAALAFLITWKKWVPEVRKIAALDMIDDAVGRATEMGRSVFFTPGHQPLTTLWAPSILAGIAGLQYTAELAAKYDTPIICYSGSPDLLPVVDEAMRTAYTKAGKADQYQSETQNIMYRYVGIMGELERKKPGAFFMIGPFIGENIVMSEIAARVGAIIIGGTPRTVQMPFFVACCDYVLIGEECYVVEAYITKEPRKLISLGVQDLGKIAAIVLSVIGLIITIAVGVENNVLLQFLSS
jgi:hypothetical protein